MNNKQIYVKNRIMNILGKDVFAPTTAKAYIPYTPNKEEYRKCFASFDYQQNIAKYKATGLPFGLTDERLESMLYFRGVLCGFVENGQAYILPFTPSNEINCYGLMTYAQPIPYITNNAKGVATSFKEHRIFHNFETMLPDDCILLFDNAPYLEQPLPQVVQNKVLIDNIVETMIKINCNLVISNKKIMLRVDNEAQADVARAELARIFGTDSPFGVIVNDMPLQEIGQSIDFNADALFNAMSSYDALRCMVSGIDSKSYGLNKAERINSGEMEGQSQQVSLKYDYCLQLRNQFAEDFNKLCKLNGIESNLSFEENKNDKDDSLVEDSIDEGIARNEEGEPDE